MLCVGLTLIWALIRPFEQRSKHFDGNRGLLWEPWASPHRKAEEAGPSFHAPLTAPAVAAQEGPGWLSVGFQCQPQSALEHSPAWRASQRVLLGEQAHVGRQLLWGGKGWLPWEQCGCMTPTPWHPRARHTAFNHPLTCISPCRMHLPEETSGWSGRTYHTWPNKGCQNKCNSFWRIWWNRGWNLLPSCQRESKH